MAKPHILFALFLAVLCAAGCSADRLAPEAPQETVMLPGGTVVNAASLQSGRMRIYVSEEMAARLENDPSFFIEENADMGVTSVQRAFPDAGQFEARTREYGLHRWYNVEFSKEVPLTKAGSNLKSFQGVTEIEYRPRLHRHTGQNVGWRHATTAAYAALAAQQAASHSAHRASAATELFNDPGLKEQWHYYNYGFRGKGTIKEGCDVNVFPVWQNHAAGSADVIVAVVDGGIDYSHEDLSANMWHNPAQTGRKRFGYNFMNDSYNVSAEDHGTHVAGTIAAVNNNRIGCCGIAGGNAAAGIPGVKLMSCQIFKQNSDDSGDDEKAIKWAADHGAVICQCSWAYDEVYEMPESTKQIIDYFDQTAGLDADGNQTGPMRGGLCIFASGNESTSSKCYPSAYEDVLAVSALGPDFKIASYSNYGDWVDIAAPGGDDYWEIYSTLPGNDYEFYSGTSMATPHVTGVAALIVANYGGEGFSRENLIDLLMRHTTDISDSNRHRYPGVGLVNAAAAIAANPGSISYGIDSWSAETEGRKATASINLSGAEDGDWVSTARVYYSKSPFTDVSGIPFYVCVVRRDAAQAPIAISTDNLEYGSTYYIAVSLQDEYGNSTAPTSPIQITTADNVPPVIAGDLPDGTIILKGHETATLAFTVSDPYGDDVKVTLTSKNKNVVKMTRDGDDITVEIRGAYSDPGNYSFTLTATDEFGLKAEVTVPYEVLENHPPVLVKPIPDIVIGDNRPAAIDLGEFITDEDGEQLEYTVETGTPSVLGTDVYMNTLTLKPKQYGSSSVTVTAADAKGKQISCTFNVLIRDGSKTVEIYPNPVTGGRLYLRVGERLQAGVSITGPSGGKVYEKTIDIEPLTPAAIDMATFPAGVYTVTVTTGGETSTERIVKL